MPDSRQERFAGWMRDHIAIVHHVVHGFAHGSDRDDLLQEVSLALWRAAAAFRGDCSESTFIYRVAHNAALTWLRSKRQHRRRVEVAIEIEWMTHPLEGRSRSATPDRLAQLYAAIRTLAPIDRSLVLLSLDGLSYREIASVHGLSESNIGARLTRARQRLAERLTEHHETNFPS